MEIEEKLTKGLAIAMLVFGIGIIVYGLTCQRGASFAYISICVGVLVIIYSYSKFKYPNDLFL